MKRIFFLALIKIVPRNQKIRMIGRATPFSRNEEGIYKLSLNRDQ